MTRLDYAMNNSLTIPNQVMAKYQILNNLSELEIKNLKRPLKLMSKMSGVVEFQEDFKLEPADIRIIEFIGIWTLEILNDNSISIWLAVFKSMAEELQKYLDEVKIDCEHSGLKLVRMIVLSLTINIITKLGIYCND